MKSKLVVFLIFLNLTGFSKTFFAMDVQDSTKTFAHPDSKTNAILNFITGKERLTDSLKAELKVKTLANTLSRCSPFGNDSILYQIELQLRRVCGIKNYLEYTQSEKYLDDALKVFYYFRLQYSENRGQGDTLQIVRDLLLGLHMIPKNTVFPEDQKKLKELLVEYVNTIHEVEESSLKNFTVEKYKTIWTMHIKHGNPKIDFTSNFSPWMWYGNRAHYSDYSNTIYLGVSNWLEAGQFINDWQAELSHAEQWRMYPIEIMKTRKQNEYLFLDSLSKTKNELSEGQSNDKEENFYTNTNLIDGYYAIEYEAHSLIEPQLRIEYKTLFLNKKRK